MIVVSFIFSILRRFQWLVVIMLFNSIIWAIDLSLSPYIIKMIVDEIISHNTQKENIFIDLLPLIIVYMGIALTVTTSFRLYGYFIDIRIMPKLKRYTVSRCFSYVLNKDYNYFQETSVGALTRYLGEVATNVSEIIQILINKFFATLLSITIAIVTIGLVHYKFALITLSWVIIFVLASILLFKKLNNAVENWAEMNAKSSGFIGDCVNNILFIKLNNSRFYEEKNLKERLNEIIFSERKLQWIYFVIWLIYSYSFNLIQALSLYFLVKGYMYGIVSVGDFALVLGINLAIVNFLGQLTIDFANFTKHFGNLGQALKTFYSGADEKNLPNKIEISKGKIEFKNVNFNYAPDVYTLDNINLTIEPEQTVALVGYSGSGKSTFINLLSGLFYPNSGEIFIDNQNIKNFSKKSLRQNISIVPQAISLFTKSILYNITYGNNVKLKTKIFEAAKNAFIDDILTLNSEKSVGEKGTKLSGGQRQRVILARIFLDNKPIVIMDEATSNLDTYHSKKIEDYVLHSVKNKTALIVTHKISFASKCDRILVFDKGKIVQDGTHTDLAKSNGVYKELLKAMS